MAHVTNNSGNVHWNTPPDILRKARRALRVEQIDFDPASNRVAQRNVRARVFLTAEDDALRPDAKWGGPTVWLNPPYANGLIQAFARRLLAELDDPESPVQRALWLSNNNTETEAASILLERADDVCFPRGRIRFLTSDEAGKVSSQLGLDLGGAPCEREAGVRGTPLQGQMILGFGETDFAQFYDLGPCR